MVQLKYKLKLFFNMIKCYSEINTKTCKSKQQQTKVYLLTGPTVFLQTIQLILWRLKSDKTIKKIWKQILI